jgi:hypothetical protein
MVRRRTRSEVYGTENAARFCPMGLGSKSGMSASSPPFPTPCLIRVTWRSAVCVPLVVPFVTAG